MIQFLMHEKKDNVAVAVVDVNDGGRDRLTVDVTGGPTLANATLLTLSLSKLLLKVGVGSARLEQASDPVLQEGRRHAHE